MAAGLERPVKELADAFHNLSLTVGPSSPPMTLEAFLGACSKVLAIITTAFDASNYLFEEFVAKTFLLVETNAGSFDLLERELIQIEQIRNNVSNGATTLAELIDQDKANHRVRFADSNCLILVRLRRSLELIKVLFQELLKGREVSLETAAENAYKSVFARYHDMLTQTIVVASISDLPTRAEIRDKLNETEDEEIIQIKRYVDGSTVVIEYVDKLFSSKEVATDW